MQNCFYQKSILKDAKRTLEWLHKISPGRFESVPSDGERKRTVIEHKMDAIAAIEQVRLDQDIELHGIGKVTVCSLFTMCEGVVE